MIRTGVAFTMAIFAGLVVSLLSETKSAAVAQAAFELAPPTGQYQVGTTSWRLTDNSRKETFSRSGEFRQVEVLAWYPAQAPRRGALAPYLREGLSEVRSFAVLLRGPRTAFDELADVRTHAGVDSRERSRHLAPRVQRHGVLGRAAPRARHAGSDGSGTCHRDHRLRQYFGQELLGQRSPLLAGEPVFPEVTVSRFPPPLRGR